MEIVADDRAVAPDFNFFATEHFSEEDGNGSLCAVGALAFAVGIRDAQDVVIEAVEVGIEVEVFFDGEFVDAVGADGFGGMGFGNGDFAGDAVYSSAGRKEDDLFYAIVLAGFEEVEGGHDVGGDIEEHVVVGDFGGGGGDEVVDDVDVFGDLCDEGMIAEVALD